MTQAALVQVASNFVAAADVAEIEAYRWGDASRAAGFYGGVAFRT